MLDEYVKQIDHPLRIRHHVRRVEVRLFGKREPIEPGPKTLPNRRLRLPPTKEHGQYPRSRSHAPSRSGVFSVGSCSTALSISCRISRIFGPLGTPLWMRSLPSSARSPISSGTSPYATRSPRR